jgi:hypothetical protein
VIADLGAREAASGCKSVHTILLADIHSFLEIMAVR